MDLESFEIQIQKTGFDLEYRISRVLEAAAWTVINNKYYIDDHQETVREIDLLAYKVRKVQHLSVYTTLIISCKKNESNIWALLAKDANPKAVNIDKWPLHIWSNDKALTYQFSQENARKKYHEDVLNAGVVEALRAPVADIFAFQEMSRVSGSPQNDKSIFGAITSLMKAQAYELTALPTRAKTPVIYQFNLLSVVESDLVRLHFRDGTIKGVPVDTDHYIARYIIQRKEMFARIHFVKAEKFVAVLDDYGRLHDANCHLASCMSDAFYSGVVTDWSRTRVLMDDFRRAVMCTLPWRVSSALKVEVDFGNLSFNTASSTAERLSIGVNAEESVLAFLNVDTEVAKEVSRTLKKIYRYEGDFVFEIHEVPF